MRRPSKKLVIAGVTLGCVIAAEIGHAVSPELIPAISDGLWELIQLLDADVVKVGE